MYDNCFIDYHTELDREYAEDLKKVKTGLDFFGFRKRWLYWLDHEVKGLDWRDWRWVYPLLEECRDEMCCPSEKHRIAMKLAMPEKIIYVSMVANEFKIPWGAAYIRLRERGIISY